MTARANHLLTTVNDQIDELIALVSNLDEPTLRLPCPGREKLGDGTVGAITQHTAANYERIAEFVTTAERLAGRSNPHGAHPGPHFLKAFGHRPPPHVDHRAQDEHGGAYAAQNVNPDAILAQLDGARSAFRRLGALSDAQLDTVPPQDSFRFCDGQRTLEQVLTSLLKHQRHQLDALDHTLANDERTPPSPAT